MHLCFVANLTTRRDATDGNRGNAGVRNLAYAKEGPSAGKEAGNAQVDRGAAEGGYTTVGVAGDAVPAVTYAAVETSNDKKKKKKKGKKEKEELQGTPLYAQVDKSKKAGAAPDDNTYAQVDMSKKKKVRPRVPLAAVPMGVLFHNVLSRLVRSRLSAFFFAQLHSSLSPYQLLGRFRKHNATPNRDVTCLGMALARLPVSRESRRRLTFTT